MKTRFSFSKLWLLLAAIGFLAVVQPYFQQGVPYTHDGENHLARFANYKIALREGQFPPRWAPNLVNHYGYPVFHYNYPLLNILSVPLSVIDVHYETTFKILMVVGVIVGSWGIWRWLALLSVTPSLRWLGITTYVLSPFLANLIFVRGNPGELWAMALFPWLLWLSDALKKRAPVSLTGAALLVTAWLLSHNVAVVFGALVWGTYSLLSLKKDWIGWKQLGQIIGLAILLSLWFWLPAIAEKSLVVLDGASLNTSPASHLVQTTQLLFSPLQFGFSYPTQVDTLSLSAGLLSLVGLAMISLWLIKYPRFNPPKDVRWWGLAGICWVLLVLQLPIAEGVWKTVPFIHFIQFPWRLTAFFVIGSIPLVIRAASLSRGITLLLLSAAIIQLVGLSRLQPADILHKNPIDYDLFSQSTSTAHENTPKTFAYQDISDWSPEPKVLTGEATIQVEHWTGTARRYRVTSNVATLIVEPTMYFAGWMTTANQATVTYADASETEGRIGYWVEPGEYVIETRFTQRTWPRIIGNSISGGAILLWGWLLWREKRPLSGRSARSL